MWGLRKLVRCSLKALAWVLFVAAVVLGWAGFISLDRAERLSVPALPKAGA